MDSFFFRFTVPNKKTNREISFYIIKGVPRYDKNFFGLRKEALSELLKIRALQIFQLWKICNFTVRNFFIDPIQKLGEKFFCRYSNFSAIFFLD